MIQQQAVSTPLPYQTEIMSRLNACYNTEVYLKKCEPLGGREIKVFRILPYYNSTIPKSWIVKCLPPENVLSQKGKRLIRSDLMREIINYRFFTEIRAEFSLCPTLMDAEDFQFLIIEDLGTNERVLPLGEVEKKLGVIMAHFHYHTGRNYPIYQKLQQTLEDPGEINAIERRQFSAGLKEIELLAAHFKLPLSTKLYDEIAQLRKDVETPGPYWGMGHNDLVNHRQCILKNDTYHLIDFEYSAFCNVLLDIAKLEYGKFEMYHKKGAFHISKPNFTSIFLEKYQQTLKDLGFEYLAPAVWNQAYLSCCIYHSVAQISRSCFFQATKTPMAFPPIFYLQYFLKDLVGKMETIDIYPELNHLFKELLTRCPK